MSPIISKKTLEDKNVLKIIEYSLDSQVAAGALRRPVYSKERVLVLKLRDGRVENTRPRISWFLDECMFKKLYGIINSREDYRRVDEFLCNEIKSSQDSKKIDDFLRDF